MWKKHFYLHKFLDTVWMRLWGVVPVISYKFYFMLGLLWSTQSNTLIKSHIGVWLYWLIHAIHFFNLEILQQLKYHLKVIWYLFLFLHLKKQRSDCCVNNEGQHVQCKERHRDNSRKHTKIPSKFSCFMMLWLLGMNK